MPEFSVCSSGASVGALSCPPGRRLPTANRAESDREEQRLSPTTAASIEPPPTFAAAAVAAVLRPGAGGEELLFIRRAEHPKDPWSGHVSFPGGRQDDTDPTPLDAALRETREELSLDLGAARLVGQLAELQARSGGRLLPLIIHPFLFRLDGDVALSPDPREVQAALWVPLAHFRDPGQRRSMPWSRDGITLRLPCYRWQEHTIWGLTLRIVDDLLTRV